MVIAEHVIALIYLTMLPAVEDNWYFRKQHGIRLISDKHLCDDACGYYLFYLFNNSLI